jgi:UDP-glucose 4-epimerase
MKILVTGGTGFIGSFVVEELLASGHEVVVISNGGQFPNYLDNRNNRLAYFQGDFGEIDVLKKALPGCDAVIHLAWSTVPKKTKDGTTFEFTGNIISSINLIEKCIDFNIDKFIFISSGGTVYGIPDEIPIRESHALNPISSYGLGKLTTERLFHLYHYSHQINYMVLRVSNAYGERQNFLKNQGVIGLWLKNILAKQDIEIWGDGSVIRDYVYVRDVARTMVNSLSLIKGSSLYNIGGGKGYSLNDIVDEIRKVVEYSFEVKYKPARNFDVPINVLDISQARERIAYQPLVNLSEGLERTWRWIVDQSR